MTTHSHSHGHGHGHGHGPSAEDFDWAEEAAALDRAAAWWRPVDQATADWLQPAAGGTAVDAGCGGGGMTVALAERVGADGRVYAVDGEPSMLETTRRRAEAHGVAAWTQTVKADLGEDEAGLSGVAEPADLVWAGHVVHHVPDQQAAVNRLARLLAPGGRLVLSEGGLPMTLLPWDVGVGTPGLEARLQAAQNDWFVDMRLSLPGAVRAPHGWPVILKTAGLVEVTSRSFLLDRPAPLDEEAKSFVLRSLRRRVERESDRLSEEDRAAWSRLLDEDDPAWLGHREDLYALAVRTVHVGRRAA